MSRSRDEFAEVITRYLLEIHGGSSELTPEVALAESEDDPHLANILSGLAYLHEDLQYREAEWVKAQRVLEDRNAELQASRARLQALATELSTPIIKVWTSVLLAPLVGSFDSGRAVDMVDRLLSAVMRERARFVILDLTGVAAVDTSTADHFLRIVGALKLLGTEAIIAGVQPSVAMSMVSLGVEVAGITTTRDAQEALLYCQQRIVAPTRGQLPK
jgi:rsbT co-antagonist protein RsbR